MTANTVSIGQEVGIASSRWWRLTGGYRSQASEIIGGDQWGSTTNHRITEW